VPNRPLRPLAFISLLALGDYLLWNWSLSVNDDILALVSGLTLLLLIIACAWLFVVSAIRTLTGTAQRPRARARTVNAGARQRAAGSRTERAAPTARPGAALGGGAVTAVGEASPASPSSKLAA
jgi:hypothetical protein